MRNLKNEKSRNSRIHIVLFIIGTSLIVISTIISLVYLPLYLNSKIRILEIENYEYKQELDTLNRDSEERDYYRLRSLILSINLDFLITHYPESPLIEGKKAVLQETEIFGLSAMARHVIDDNELKEKQNEWTSMDLDQLQTEWEIIGKKFDDLVAFNNNQEILMEQKFAPVLELKETLLYVIPFLFILGTILDEIATFLRYKNKND